MVSFLIDGYNLLNHAPILSPGPKITREGRRQGELETARGKLLEFLASHLSEKERRRSAVVFDAREAPRGLPRKCRFQGMTVYFASEYPDADTMIESLIEEHSAPRSLTVVSSDRRLQKAARRRRARFAESRQWYRSLSRRTRTSTEPSPKPSPVPPTPLKGATSFSQKFLRYLFGGKRDRSEPTSSSEATASSKLSQTQIEAWLEYFGFDESGLSSVEISETTEREASPSKRSPRHDSGRTSKREKGPRPSKRRKTFSKKRARTNKASRREETEKNQQSWRHQNGAFFPDEYLEEIQRMIDREEGADPSDP